MRTANGETTSGHKIVSNQFRYENYHWIKNICSLKDVLICFSCPDLHIQTNKLFVPCQNCLINEVMSMSNSSVFMIKIVQISAYLWVGFLTKLVSLPVRWPRRGLGNHGQVTSESWHLRDAGQHVKSAKEHQCHTGPFWCPTEDQWIWRWGISESKIFNKKFFNLKLSSVSL